VERVLEEGRAMERAAYARDMKKRDDETRHEQQKAALWKANQDNYNRQKHQQMIDEHGPIQNSAISKFSPPEKRWKYKVMWDDWLLGRMQTSLHNKAPPVGTYNPVDVNSSKRKPRSCTFGKAPRFSTERNEWKRQANLPGPADLIPDRRCATPTCTSGGLISKSYVEKPAWVNLTNGHHHGVPKHMALDTPPPDHYQQDVSEYARKQLLTRYLPTRNTATISKASGKTEIEWLEYYASQVPGPGDHHINRDLANTGVERVNGRVPGGKIPNSSPPDSITQYTNQRS